jgi:hypothetical protein
MFKKLIIWICFVTALGSSTVLAQSTPTDAPGVKAVNHCVSVVHDAHTEPGFEHFYKNFDAYYNAATGGVENNAQTYGDQKALYVFNKCMAQQGFPLKFVPDKK